MPIEIERKYLVDFSKWIHLNKPKGAFFKQGYLFADPNKTIRIRLTEESGYLTIKGLSVGASRPEFEYEIPMQEAKELLDNFATSCLTKTRYKMPFKNKIWEVDVFHEENEGLIVAEIELQHESEAFDIPDWIGEEVTGHKRYYNSNISIHPFKNW